MGIFFPGPKGLTASLGRLMDTGTPRTNIPSSCKASVVSTKPTKFQVKWRIPLLFTTFLGIFPAQNNINLEPLLRGFKFQPILKHMRKSNMDEFSENFWGEDRK